MIVASSLLISACSQYLSLIHIYSRKESELRDTEGRIRLLKDIEPVVKQAEYRDKNKISTKRMEQAKEMERV